MVRWYLASALCILHTACLLDLPSADRAQTYPCNDADDCLAGYACVAGYCTAADAHAGDPGGGDPGPGDTGGGDGNPGDPPPGDTGSGDTGPGDTGPGDTGPGDSNPGDPAPSDPGSGDPGPSTGTVVAIDAANHTCVRHNDNTVSCWGANDTGQLGGGVVGTASASPMRVPTINDAVSLAVGGQHTCVARSSGQVSCWGSNVSNRLGNDTVGSYSLTPVPVSALPADDVQSVAAGHDFTCALRVTGAVVCWGGNIFGQLGDSAFTATNSATAVQVELPGGAVALSISAGDYFACARVQQSATTSVYCWGNNQQGQVEPANIGTGPARVPVDTGHDGWRLATGGDHACIIGGTGIGCWGDNLYGQHGNGSTTDVATFSTISGIDGLWLSSGHQHSCAVASDGSAWCWGTDENGRCGGDLAINVASAPLQVRDEAMAPLSLAEIAAGTAHSCGITPAGEVYCWGDNALGNLGRDPASLSDSAAALLITGL